MTLCLTLKRGFGYKAHNFEQMGYSMKKSLLALGMVCLSVQFTLAQSTLVNSWENSVEGWATLQANWTSGGFSSTNGVTAGNYSWVLNAAGTPDYGAAIEGTASASMTALLINAASVSIDVYATGFSSLQWDLVVNQQGNPAGDQSTDAYAFDRVPTIGSQSTLTFSMPDAIKNSLATNSTLPTSLTFQIGGVGGGTVYLDNLVVTAVPEPAALALAGVGVAFLLLFLRRHRS